MWQAGAIAEEVLASIRTVVAFGGQKKEVVKKNRKRRWPKKTKKEVAKKTEKGAAVLRKPKHFYTMLFSHYGWI